MVKKGKEKSGGGSNPASSSGKKAPAEDDFIVFTNSTKEKDSKAKKSGGPSASAASTPTPAGAPEGPPKPTIKQIIGGASWTGKLPVNLLSEHCQKQKWDKPEYDTVSLYPCSAFGDIC